MAQVTDVPFESIPDELKPLYRKFTGDYGDFTNQVRVLAHSPDAFRHLYGLLDAWRDRGTLTWESRPAIRRSSMSRGELQNKRYFSIYYDRKI